MNLDDVGAAIEEHSHYDADAHAEWSNDTFWENLWDEHGAEYQAQTAHPSLSDFQVYCDEHDWVPDVL